jgi:hypothetical protein
VERGNRRPALIELAEVADRAVEHVADPRLHLPRRLVGERDGQDRAGDDAEADQVGDAPRDDAGLAAAGGGDDQERAVHVRDGFALRVGQIGKQLLGVDHAVIVAARRGCVLRRRMICGRKKSGSGFEARPAGEWAWFVAEARGAVDSRAAGPILRPCDSPRWP